LLVIDNILKMKLKSIISIIKTSFSHWQNHRASRMGAALSYYAIFSIVPLLMLALVVIGPISGDEYIQTAIVEQVHTLINAQSANFIQSLLIALSQIKFNFFTIIISIGTLIFGALGVFFGFLLIISLVFSGLISFISGYSPIFARITYLYQVGSFIFSFFVLSFLFTFIYRFLPKRKLPWKELIRGALITTVLFMIGKSVLSLTITQLAGASIFGATEAFVVLLLWVYYSVQIFLFGASLTYVYSRRYGHLKEQ